RLRSINEIAPPMVVWLMEAANLPVFAPSCDGAAELFFIIVKHRGIRRHIFHDLFQRLKRHWRTGIAQGFTFTLAYYL
ncbi:hypothetical protein AF381_24625, partial [Salmonella enterica subsp. enterica serovar Typhimurium]